MSTTARRVARDLTSDFKVIPNLRKEISYRGGLQNSVQKLQWFWFGFKKYGFLQNFANILRMREAWWETGEKRLIGMDSQGHRYWETDEIGRKWQAGFRWIDYPYHCSWHDLSKIPEEWYTWGKMCVGRSPPQMEALHNELGPAWRDYNKNYNWKTGIRESDKDFFTSPAGMDASHRGHRYYDPWSPHFKEGRRHYGHSMLGSDETGRYLHGVRNVYDVDEYDPDGGAKGKLELNGLGPDAHAQERMSYYVDEDHNRPMNKFFHPNSANASLNYEVTDKGALTSAIWWDYRKSEGRVTKESRASVSAFEDPVQSPLNKTNAVFGFESRYMKAADKDVGYARSKSNPKNHRFHSPLDALHPETFQGKNRKEYNYNTPVKGL